MIVAIIIRNVDIAAVCFDLSLKILLHLDRYKKRPVLSTLRFCDGECRNRIFKKNEVSSQNDSTVEEREVQLRATVSCTCRRG